MESTLALLVVATCAVMMYVMLRMMRGGGDTASRQELQGSAAGRSGNTEDLPQRDTGPEAERKRRGDTGS